MAQLSTLGLMHTRHFNIAILLLLCICASGCVRDVSHDSRYPTDYAVGRVYRVKQPLFAQKADLTIFGTYSYYILSTAQKNVADIPVSVEAYDKDRAYWTAIAGVAMPGTRLKVSKIVYRTNWEAGDGIWIEAMILDGSLAGSKPAELHFISREVDRRSDLSVYIPMVDTNILELVP